jgi:predicted GTPase
VSTSYEKILNELQGMIDRFGDFDIQKHLSGFKDREFFSKIENVYADFEYELKRALDDAKRAVESPIYIGVIGHYSHGKSSLLNAMLTPPKAKELLPTGDGIVTSKCTLAQFTDDGGSNCFWEVKDTGEEVHLSDVEYQAKVSGKRSGAIQGINHFRLVLDAKNLADDVYANMARKRIELLDTPGLGGPYWKDEHALQQWMKEFMLLIVCVRADQINQRTAASVNPFLKQTARPVIPVVTFWDLWQSSPDFQNISDESLAREKAKELLVRYFPSLGDAVDEGHALFVSARNYREDVEVPRDKTYFYTEDWNVDSLRNALGSYVNDRMSILVSQRPEESSLERRRKENVIASCQLVSARFSSLEPMLKRVIEDVRPKEAYEEELADDLVDLRDKVKEQFEIIVSRLYQIIDDGIANIPTSGKWNTGFNEIAENVKGEFERQLSENFKNKIEKVLDRSIERHLFSYIEDKTPLSTDQKKRLIVRLKDKMTRFVQEISEASNTKLFTKPSGAADVAISVVSAIWSGIKLLFLVNAPLGIGVSILFFIWVAVVPKLMDFVSNNWIARQVVDEKKMSEMTANLDQAFSIAYWLGILFVALVFLGLGWKKFQENIQRTCMELKEKARKLNRESDIKSRVIPEIEKKIEVLGEDLREELRESLRDVSLKSGDFLAEIEEIVVDARDAFKRVERECGAISRGKR